MKTVEHLCSQGSHLSEWKWLSCFWSTAFIHELNLSVYGRPANVTLYKMLLVESMGLCEKDCTSKAFLCNFSFLFSDLFFFRPNRPFPSSLVPLFQSESKCETFHIKMSSVRSFFFMQIKVIFIRMVSHLDSLWNRGTRELGNGLLDSSWEFVHTCISLNWRNELNKETTVWLFECH